MPPAAWPWAVAEGLSSDFLSLSFNLWLGFSIGFGYAFGSSAEPRLRPYAISIRVSNFARCTEKNVRTLRTLAWLVNARWAIAWYAGISAT